MFTIKNICVVGGKEWVEGVGGPWVLGQSQYMAAFKCRTSSFQFTGANLLHIPVRRVANDHCQYYFV